MDRGYRFFSLLFVDGKFKVVTPRRPNRIRHANVLISRATILWTQAAGCSGTLRHGFTMKKEKKMDMRDFLWLFSLFDDLGIFFSLLFCVGMKNGL